MKKLGLVLFVVLGFLSQICTDRYTRVDLTETESGRRVFSVVLKNDEQVTMSWRNSLFGLDVIEVFRARQGILVLDEITFTDPRGFIPPEVTAADVDDLYHTGGPFTAHGVGKSFSRVAFRVGEIGNPKVRIRDRVVSFVQEVGFGGGLVLTAAPPTWLEVFL